MEHQRTYSHEALNRLSEGPRRIRTGPSSAYFEYEIARLPDGRHAMRYDYSFPGNSGGFSGWDEHDTREDCVAELRALVMKVCRPDGHMSQGNRRAAEIIRRRIDPGDLFGFQEPDPLPRQEWLPGRVAFEVEQKAVRQGYDLLNVVRGGDYRPISPAKDGSFFAIPTPWSRKNPAKQQREEASAE